MLKAKVVLPILMFGLVLLLAGCDNKASPLLSQAEAVKLAKSVATQLASSPRLLMARGTICPVGLINQASLQVTGKIIQE